MLNFLAQNYNYNYDYTTDSAAATGMSAAFSIVLLLIMLPVLIIVVASMWKVFVKAGEAGWKALIPFYNTWITAELAGKPGWWGLAGLLSIIPFVGWIGALIVSVIIYMELAKAFGKDQVFGLLLAFIPIVGFPILAFGPAKYVGKKFDTMGGSSAKPAATPPASA